VTSIDFLFWNGMKTSRKTIILGTGLIMLLTLAAYIPAISGGYIWDDNFHITDNPTLRTVEGLGNIWFDLGAVPQYYPMVHTFFWLEYHLWELHPLGYHLVNVLLHGLSGVLLWLVLRYLSVPGAWLAAAVFALHPVQVESVAWITERKNVLSGFFYLASLLTYLHLYSFEGKTQDTSSLRVHSPGSTGLRPRWLLYVLSLILYLCALLSKTVTCSMPAAILLILWWKRNSIGKTDVLALIPHFVMGISLGLLTVWMERHFVGAQGEAWAFSFIDRCLIAGRALWFYAGKLVWPQELTFIYPQWQIDSNIWWQFLFPLAAATVIIILWLLRERIGKGPLVAVLFFAGTLFPALGFFDVYPMQYSFVADHFQYLASIGLIVLATAGTATFLERLGPLQACFGFAVCLGVLFVLGLNVWQQGKIYKDIETLWRDTIAKNPAAWMPHNNLGATLQKQGKLEEAIAYFSRSVEIKPDHEKAHSNLGVALQQQGKFKEAIESFSKALTINPDFAGAHNNLGTTLQKQGRLEEAVVHFSKALQIEPNYAEAHSNLAVALDRQGKFAKAIVHYRLAMEIKPDYAEAHNNLGATLARQAKYAEAITYYSRAIEIRPHYVEAHYNLADALEKQGQLHQAITQYRQAIKIDPDLLLAHFKLALVLLRDGRTAEAIAHYQEALRLSDNSPSILNNLAWLFATHKNPKFRDGEKAVQLAAKACLLTNQNNATYLDTLAAAYAEIGRFDEAVQTAQKAVELARASGQTGLAKDMENRILLYRAGKPFYEG
jgi:tetratricopeptide (TPR) repeat protein